jgi:hypothetical protein
MTRRNYVSERHRTAEAIALLQAAEAEQTPEAAERACKAVGLWVLSQPGVPADVVVAALVARLDACGLEALRDLSASLDRELRRRAKRDELAALRRGGGVTK